MSKQDEFLLDSKSNSLKDSARKEEQINSEEMERLLPLQNQLITACEQGDLKGVKFIIQQGAKTFYANAEGKQPLGAAAWGMNPEIVDYLLINLEEQKIPTWEACQSHNMKHYKEIFLIDEFKPQIFETWSKLLKKMNANLFVQGIHLQQLEKFGLNYPKLNIWSALRRSPSLSAWENLCEFVESEGGGSISSPSVRSQYLYYNNLTRNFSYMPSLLSRQTDFSGIWALGSITESCFKLQRDKIQQTIEKAVWAQSPGAVSPLPAKDQPQEVQFKDKEIKKRNPFVLLPEPKPAIKAEDAKQVRILLRLVAEGEQAQAEAIIKQNPSLLLASGELEDLSNRKFQGITAFQYAVWAMDWHMWKMIHKYLPAEEAVKQFNMLEVKGLGEYGRHISWEPLINALAEYNENAGRNWYYGDLATNHWRRVVGRAQRELPAHVVNEYCRKDRSFSPCPEFTEETLPRIRTSSCGIKGDWFTVRYQGKLCGESFAFYRSNTVEGAQGRASCAGWWNPKWWISGDSIGRDECVKDLIALRKLLQIRTKQLEQLRSQMMTPSMRMA